MINKEELVVLKGPEYLYLGTNSFKPHNHYRHMVVNDSLKDTHIVYGFPFGSETFNRLFESSYTRILRDFKSLGMINLADKPITKTKFKALADIHTYGTGRKALSIFFFRKTRDCIYGFYPQSGSKKAMLDECYGYFLDLVNGKMDSLDEGDVRFKNTGIPIMYS